jgi:hypothetical protein
LEVTEFQRIAIAQHCRLSIETMRDEFRHVLPGLGVSVILTVNSGYE